MSCVPILSPPYTGLPFLPSVKSSPPSLPPSLPVLAQSPQARGEVCQAAGVGGVHAIHVLRKGGREGGREGGRD